MCRAVHVFRVVGHEFISVAITGFSHYVLCYFVRPASAHISTEFGKAETAVLVFNVLRLQDFDTQRIVVLCEHWLNGERQLE